MRLSRIIRRVTAASEVSKMKQRAITAIILIAFVAPFVYLGGWYIIALATLFVLGATFEILKVRHNRQPSPALHVVTYLGAIVIFIWNFIIFYVNHHYVDIPSPFLVQVNVVFLAMFLIALLLLEVTHPDVTIGDIFYNFTMTFFIATAGQAAIFIRFLHDNTINTLLFVLVVNYACDTLAYLTGYFFGKHKMAPITSPKKTWEGAIGGVFFATILGALSYVMFPFGAGNNVWVVLVISFFLAISGICGDLIFSSIKRHYNIKDFGTIFPGHGGILDRVDSLLFNVLTFVAIYALFTGGVFV
jgi:phosphatidate cytidylyltransferase